jgi:hypothetical protein
MALSDVVGRMGFSVDLSSDLRHLGEGELVNVTKLDEWIAASGLERLDFIKLDVEGAEFKVLQGGIKTLRRFIPTILFEYIPENTTWFGGYRRDEMVRMMEGLGYTVGRVTQSGALSEDLERTDDVTNNYLAYASY